MRPLETFARRAGSKTDAPEITSAHPGPVRRLAAGGRRAEQFVTQIPRPPCRSPAWS